jgi:hypothetical protein
LFADLVAEFSPEVQITQLSAPILDEKSVD